MNAKRHAGFTLIELIFTIAILGIVMVVAFNKIVDLRTSALKSSEDGVAGAVRSGITLYRNESDFINRTPVYPATLDTATTGSATQTNPFFFTVLTQGVQSGWTKNASTRYTGPANGVYNYDNVAGTFLRTGTFALYSSFDANDSGWSATGGHIAVQGGRYVFGSTGNNRSYVGDTSWTNYTVDTQATLSSNDPYSLLFRLSSASNPSGYAFQYDPTYNSGAGAFLLRQWVNGSASTIFATASAPAGFQWLGTDHAVRLNVQGSTFTASIDGQQVITGSNAANATGRVGVSVNGGSASFDNFQVTTTP